MHGLILVALLARARSSAARWRSGRRRPRRRSPSGSAWRRRTSASSWNRCGRPSYTVAAVRFPSPIVTPDPENNTVHAEYFRPVGPGRRPAVVVLHILGADFALSRYLAARLADRGVAALFVKLPYYGERRPPGGEKRFLSADIERSVMAMGQGICDVRRAVAWLASRPEVDPGKLGVTGISLGGIVSSVAAAVDPTINRPPSSSPAATSRHPLGDARRGEIPQALDRVGPDPRRPPDHDPALRPADLCRSPGREAADDDRRQRRRDDLPRLARALWDAAGRPPIRWYDCGHYSAVGFLLPAIRETVEFFAADLDP